MPKKVTILQVLVSSPADLRQERDLLYEIVEELNVTWRTSSNIQLNLLTWEKDSRPALAEDAQAAINVQLGDDCDIFIGMMAARFGSPTGRAESGTEEEFERARSRFEQDPKSVAVMFYFKDAAPLSLSEIDPKQLERVQRFRKRVEHMGLVRVFKTRDEFARLMRIHLSQEVQEWSKRLQVGVMDPRKVELRSVEGAITVQAEEEGYLDLLEKGIAGFEALTRIMERITSAVIEVSRKTDERRAEIDELNASAQATGVPSDMQALKRISNHLAAHLDEFVARLDAEVPIFAAAFKRAIDPFTKALSMSEIHPPPADQMASVKKATAEMVTNQEHLITNYHAMRESLINLPRATTVLNHSKRHTIDSVTRLLDEFEKSLRLTREFHDFLTRFAEGPEKGNQSGAACRHNKALATQIRERAKKLADEELQAKALHLAQIVEQAETEAPASVLDLIFRKPTATERDRGLELETIARQLLEKHGKAVA